MRGSLHLYDTVDFPIRPTYGRVRVRVFAPSVSRVGKFGGANIEEWMGDIWRMVNGFGALARGTER